jgi:hypothetical protein
MLHAPSPTLQAPRSTPLANCFLSQSEVFQQKSIERNYLADATNSNYYFTMKNIIPFALIAFTSLNCSKPNSSCFKGNCLYNQGQKSNYQAYFISPTSDTTWYQIKLITEDKLFLFQKKLKYVVERIPNSSFPSSFISESTTGYFEDFNRIWLHPPRTDIFKWMTQLAPYPEVKNPMEIGDTIRGSINMLGNWGAWSGHASSFYLTAVKDSVILNQGQRDSVLVLSGCGNLLEDTSCVTYLFSFTQGFIFAEYQNNKGEKFVMKLITN